MPRPSNPATRLTAELRDAAKARKEAIEALEKKFVEATRDASEKREKAYAEAMAEYEQTVGPADQERQEAINALEVDYIKQLDDAYEKFKNSR